MVPWIMLLALVGLLLVVVEFLIPGFGAFGILGTILLFLSTILIAHNYGTVAFLITVAILIVICILLVVIVRKKKVYNKFILSEKRVEQDFDETTIADLIGKEGVTTTQLRPYGKAIIEQKQVDVFSEGNFVDRNVTVQVISISGKNVVVKQIG